MIPILYTAPASYKCLPVEAVFGAIKLQNYENADTPIHKMIRIKEIEKLT